MKNLSLFNKFVLLLNNLAAIALLIGYITWFVNPSNLPIFGIISLGVPLLLAINFLFVLYWLILRKKQITLSLICLAAGWWHIGALYQFSGKAETAESAETFRVMTYNVKHYYPNHPWKDYAPKAEMVAMMEDVNPDIFCAQEFQSAKKWVPQKRLKYTYQTTTGISRLAIYSAYKIINKGEVKYTEDEHNYSSFIFADVLCHSDTLRIINVHLKSIGLENQDLKTFADLDNITEEEKVKNSGKNILKMMLAAYKIRGYQVDGLAEFIKKSPHKVILCGDFNDTPTSYSYQKLTQNLADSYLLAGSGFVATHPKFYARKIPMRIDYILASPALLPTKWDVVKESFSDHFPVFTDYEM